MHPILRPGFHVLKRGDGELQVGLDPRRAVVLPDTVEVRASLRLLGSPGERIGHADSPTVELLEQAGLVVDAGVLVPLIPVAAAPQDGALSRHEVAALAGSLGDHVARAVEQRAAHGVDVLPFGGPPGDRLGAKLMARVVASGMPARRPASPETARPPRLGVLVGVGEPQRELLDPWVRAGTAHVLVRMSEGQATVGPFVVPGITACLRCVDAHCTDADPSWPLLVAQHASATARERADGVPEPCDGLLADVAVAWAVRDLASYAEGRRPSTWSATITFDPHLCDIESRPWLRHRACGCSWG